MALVTVARAKQNKALSAVGTTYLSNLIDAASAYIVNYLDTEVEAGTTTTEVQYGTGLSYFHTKNFPITELVSVISTNQSGDEETVLAANLNYNAATGRISTADSASICIWPRYNFPSLTVSYSYGYETVPEAIQEACCQVVSNMFGTTNSKNPQLTEMRMGEYTEKRGGAGFGGSIITPSVAMLLAQYRRLASF